MAEHTSGPWQLHSPTEGDPITGDGSYCITGPGGGVIADIVPKDWHETPANARLIVVAPELLKVLENIVVDMRDDMSVSTIEDHGLFLQALQLIDKATGREVSDG